MQASPIHTDIVLLGGGHSHVFVLKAFGMKPIPGVRLTLVAKELAATYSGMLPGFVAGHYTLEDCQIDLVRLARFAGARLIHGAADGIDRAAKRVSIIRRPPIRYDLLSIDVGVTPLLDAIAGAHEHAIAVKPVSIFAQKWLALEARALAADGPRRIAAIGGGAAGIELILAARHRLSGMAQRGSIDPQAFKFMLAAGGSLLPSHNARARALARAALTAEGVAVIENDPAVAVDATAITLRSGRTVAADAVLVSTKAAPPSWFAGFGLPLDTSGFLAARPTLQLLDDDDVFAVGDCASVIEHPREKSGVFAVRQGPVVADNLRRRALGEAATPFIPQRQFLSLVSLGGKSAIASRGSIAAAGHWAWRWKDHIDRQFMENFNNPPAMTNLPAIETGAMRCGGCAAKVGPVTLARALDRLQGNKTPREDAAVLDDGGELLRLETVDFFRAFWPDAYVLGEIAANHALNDIFAMGGKPRCAQAIAVLPHGAPRIVEEDLFQLLAGARQTFDREGVTLIGGHSSEGAELSVGFAISGAVARSELLRKSGLNAGQALILTRPIGTGILFAAEMRGLATAHAIEAALATMRNSNRIASECLSRHGATAMTDVTGFGLAGHLFEMLDASGTDAQLDLSSIPVYWQAHDLADAGVASSLLPENISLSSRMTGAAMQSPAALALLFDPQTSGGLIAGIPADRAEACVEDLRRDGNAQAAMIGNVLEKCGATPGRLRVNGAFRP